jgi:hypothetical protein
MPELPRDLPHLYLRGSGRPERYTSKRKPSQHPLPQRDRTTHATGLRTAIIAALAAADVRRTDREPALTPETPGFYLDFEIPPGSENAAELLENRPRHIELAAVRQESDTAPAVATVFIPDTAVDHFLKKIEQYRNENTPAGKPKNEALIARIQNIALAAVRSVYTDDPALFPAAGQEI